MADRSIIQRLDTPIISITLIVRLFLGAVFLVMGLNKIAAPFEFLKQVNLYNVLPVDPPQAMNLVALGLPWLEVVCGFALILGVWSRAAALHAALMLAVFTPVIFLRALAIQSAEGTPFFDIAFDCGCGTGVEIIWQKLLKNTGLFLCAWVIILSRSTAFSLSAFLQRRFAQSSPEKTPQTTGEPVAAIVTDRP